MDSTVAERIKEIIIKNKLSQTKFGDIYMYLKIPFLFGKTVNLAKCGTNN